MRWLIVGLPLLLWTSRMAGQQKTAPAPLTNGHGIELNLVIPANERGILCLAQGKDGRIYGGTTGRAAHFFVYEPKTGVARSLVRLAGGIGFSYALLALPDGTFITGTQADPTGTAVKTETKASGRLLRLTPQDSGPAKIEELGIPVPGQGIYTLAYDGQTQMVVGNTWPDGHFFTYDLKSGKFKDHGAIAGHRTYETPGHANDLNKHTKENVFYPRQVSRAIVAVPGFGALTGGADGYLYRYDFAGGKLAKTAARLPAVPGREPWASLDVAVPHTRKHQGQEYTSVVGGTSDGHLFELRIVDKSKLELRARGRPFAQGTIQGLVLAGSTKGGPGEGQGFTFVGVGGHTEGMPRTFIFRHGGSQSAVIPGGIPSVDGQASMVGFGAMMVDDQGTIYAGERDRLGRLVRFGSPPPAKAKKERPPVPTLKGEPEPEKLPKLPCRVVFAPEGTTTDGSGYTALAVGLDGKVYVGSARYGGYGWLLVFDPRTGSLFMEKIVNMKQLSGERLRGINTQGKIHAIIIVGPDGRIWFASKQAHEIFGTRPEYAEELEGYPGGHLCYYDPKTGFSRSMGILKKQEGLMAGALDPVRNKLYYRSEPKNIFLSYDIKTGAVKELGHIGANCRYMAIDKAGAVYQPGRGDYLARFDPETGYVEDLAVKLDGPGFYSAPYVVRLGPNGKLYGAGISHPWILEYDIANYKKGPFPHVTVRNVAPAAPPGMHVHDIHAGVFGKDGKFYYPLVTSADQGKKTPRRDRHLRIMRFDPATGKSATVGIPDTSSMDESKVKHVYNRGTRYELDYIQGAAVGADGTLYLMDIYPQLNVACFPKLTAPR